VLRSAALLCAALILAGASPVLRAAPARSDLLFRAHTDARPSLTHVHLLLSSVQAELKNIEWDLGWWGLVGLRREAQRRSGRWDRAVEAFRKKAESIPAAADPAAPLIRQAAASGPVAAKAVEPLPGSAFEMVSEIRSLRARYDADDGRAALIRAAAAIERLRQGRKPLPLKPFQSSLLDAARSLRVLLASIIAQTRRDLPGPGTVAGGSPGKDHAGRERLAADLGLLERESEALMTETRKLAILFEVHNELNDPHGDQRGRDD